ncbi:Type II secretory pathway component [Pseudomonas sp. SST3]|uniref:Type II secretory pathway component n=1 Tax=Pseudomonas sp. SST3 TaxID=2267882 RepID=UPI00313970A2
MFKFAVKILGLASLVVAAAPVFALDPTQPPAGRVASDAQAKVTSALRLQAILRSGGRAHAVVDGQTLKVGDHLGDARISAIRPHSVVIDRHGQQQELRLSAPIIQSSRTQP